MMLRRYHKRKLAAKVTPEQVKEVFVEAPKEEKVINYSDMTVEALKAALTDKDIEIPAKAKKADLIKLLEESE